MCDVHTKDFTLLTVTKGCPSSFKDHRLVLS